MLHLIEKYGLSVKKIPDYYYKPIEFNSFKEGDLIEVDQVNFKQKNSYEGLKSYFKSNPAYIFKDEDKTILKRVVKRKTIPENAGYWMCKRSTEEDVIKWRGENLSPTLEGSILKFVEAESKRLMKDIRKSL